MANYTESQYGQELLWGTPLAPGKPKWGDTPKTYKASDRQEGLPSFLNDIRRNLGNLGGSVTNWFMGRPNVEGGGLGDATVGRDPNQILGASAGKVIDPETQAMLDALNARNAALESQLNGAQTPDAYDSLISTLQGRSQTDDARLQAMYQAAADYVTGMRPDVEGIYSQAKAGYEGANQAAGNVVNTGFTNSRNALTNMLQTLGIEDAATNILARGEDMSANQNAATGRLADYLNANLSRNTAGQTAALENLGAMAQAIMGEGARSRSANARSIEDQISQTRASQQSANMQAQQAAAALAAKGAGQPTSQQLGDRYTEFYNYAKNNLKFDDTAAQNYAQKQTALLVG